MTIINNTKNIVVNATAAVLAAISKSVNALFNNFVGAIHCAAAEHAIELTTTPAGTTPAVTKPAVTTPAGTPLTSSVLIVTSDVAPVIFVALAPWVKEFFSSAEFSRAEEATSETCTALVLYTPPVSSLLPEEPIAIGIVIDSVTSTATATAAPVCKKSTLRIDIHSPQLKSECTTPPSVPRGRSGNFKKLQRESKVEKKLPNYMKSTGNVRTRRSKSTRKKQQTNFCLDWTKSKTQRFSTSTKKGQRRNLAENQKARNTRMTTSKNINKCRQRRAQLECIFTDYKL